MKDQSKRGDGLVWIGDLFRPKWYKSLLYRMVSPFMLESDPKAMGRGVRRMPFRKALKRDVWEQSEAAKAVGDQWGVARSKGGKTSFANDAETSKDEQSEHAISS
jgi:hypothetical protein